MCNFTKIPIDADLDKLKKIGNYWETPDKKKQRYYLGDTDKFLEIIGLECGTYKTGNISWAERNGKKISNRRASNIRNYAKIGKIFYDLKTKELVIDKYLSCYDEIENFYLNTIKR